jgi:hypothetical protein
VRSLALSCAYLASCAASGRRALVTHGVLQWLGSYVSADVTSSSTTCSHVGGELQDGALDDVSSEPASYVYACLLNNMAQVSSSIVSAQCNDRLALQVLQLFSSHCNDAALATVACAAKRPVLHCGQWHLISEGMQLVSD